ncbi:MAG: hypothetical protein RMX68_012375 [Aulosira sp. ZfuVER01]
MSGFLLSQLHESSYNLIYKQTHNLYLRPVHHKIPQQIQWLRDRQFLESCRQHN